MWPLVGPEGVVGVETLQGMLIVTVLLEEYEDATLVLLPHRAWALTWYVPGEPHDFDALVEELQEENVPSPQSKRY